MEYLTYLYKFEVFVQRLEISLRKGKIISIIWKKGKKLVQSQRYSGYSRGVMVIQQSLHLNLKLYKDPQTRDFLPKFSTFSICEHQGDRRRILAQAKFNLLQMLIATRRDFTLPFPHNEFNARLVFRGQQQLIMELNQFRFNTQQLQESEEENNTDLNHSDDQVHIAAPIIEQQHIALKKQIEDLSYLNVKLKGDRQKLMLRVREVEFEFKQKQKLILRQIRHAKAYYEKKIKIRENVYEEEIERLVAETNEQQGVLARAQDNMRDEIRELRIRGAKAQSDILELREENTKLRFQLEDREEQLKSAAIEKAQEERRVSEVIRKLEQEIGQFQGDVTAMVAAITSEKEEAVKEQGMKLENLSKSLTAEIDKRMKQLEFKDKSIAQLTTTLSSRDQKIKQLSETLKNLQGLMTSKNVLLLQTQNTKNDITSSLKQLLTQKSSLQQQLSSTKQSLSKYKSQHHSLSYELTKLHTELQMKQHQLTQKQQLYEQRERGWTEDLTAKTEELERRDGELYELRNQVAMLEADKENLEQEIRHVANLRDIAQENHERVVSENQHLKEELDQVYQQNKEVNIQVLKADDDIGKLRTDIQLKEMALAEFKSSCENLQTQLSNEKRRNQELEIEVRRAMDDRENHQSTELAFEALHTEVKTLQNENQKLKKQNKQMKQKVQKMVNRERSHSLDRQIMAELIQIQSDKSYSQDISMDVVQTMRSQLQQARSSVIQLKKQLLQKQQLIRDLQMPKVSDMKGSIDRMIRDGNGEAIRQMLADTEKKLVNSNRMKEDLQSKVAELQERIQKQAEQLKEKEARMQGLISKMGDSAIRSDSQDDNTARKFKDLLRQQNQDHQAQRTDLLSKLAQQQSMIQQLRRQLSLPTANRGRMQNFSFMPGAARPNSPKQFDPAKVIAELQKKLQASEAENRRLVTMAEEFEKQSMIKEPAEHLADNSGDLTDEVNVLKRRGGEITPVASPLIGVMSVASFSQQAEIQKQLKQKLQQLQQLRQSNTQLLTQLTTLQSQHSSLQSQLLTLQSQHSTTKQSLQQLQHQLLQKQSQLTSTSKQITILKQQQLQTKFIEREIKLREESMAVESEKRVARVNEEMAMVKEAKDKLEAALRDMNQGVGDRERELERVRMEAVLRDRELAEARRLRDEAVRDLNQLKENHLREAKRAYEDPAQARLRELTKELSRAKDTEYQLKSQLQKQLQQRKDKYIRLSQYKQSKSELQRIIKDKSSQVDSLQKQLQQLSQSKLRSQFSIKSLQSQLQQSRRKLTKTQQQHKSALQDRQTDMRLAKKKLAAAERQQQQHQAKITQLQEKQKALNQQHEKMVEQMNKKIMQQLREGLQQKEQAEILADELKSVKKRHAEATKHVQELEDRMAVLVRQYDEQKRVADKLHKDIEEKQEQAARSSAETKKLNEQLRRKDQQRDQLDRDKRQLQQQIQRLQKSLSNQQLQMKKLLKQLQKAKYKATQTEQDQVTSSKTLKIQLQKSEQMRRKLEKAIEERDMDLKGLEMRLRGSEEEKRDAIDALNQHYTEKLAVYVGQIENIKKTIREYEDQITSLKSNARELADQLEHSRYKIGSMESDLRVATQSLQAKSIDLHNKREQCQKVRQQKYQSDLLLSKTTTQLNMSTQQTKKLSQRLSKLLQQNRTLSDQSHNLQLDLRSLKSSNSKLQHQLNSLRGSHQRCRQLQSHLKKLQIERQDLMADISHKNELIYSQQDFERFQENMRANLIKEQNAEFQEAVMRSRLDSEQNARKMELEMVELLNEATRLRADLERSKEHNATLLAENLKMLEYQRQAADAERKMAEFEALIKERDRNMAETKATHEKSLKDIEVKVMAYERELQNVRMERTEFEKEMLRGRKMQEEQAESMRRNEEKGIEVLQKVNQDLRNKMLQIEFENARLKESELALQSAYQRRINQLQKKQQQKGRLLQTGYIQAIQRYQSQTQKLRISLQQLKYMLQDRDHQLNFRRQQIDYYQSQLSKQSEQLKRFKAKSSEQKQTYSLEIFKLTSRLKQNDEQWSLKVKRLEEELARVTNQLVQTSSRVERELTYSKLKIMDPEEKMAKRFEEKVRLKERAIEELKDQIMGLEERLFRAQQEQIERGADPGAEALRIENARLREELQDLKLTLADSPTTQKLEIEVNTLNESVSNYKKQVIRNKKTQQDLNQKIDQLTLQLSASSSEVAFLKNYQNSYRELKVQFQRVHQQLRTIKAENQVSNNHAECELRWNLLLQEKIEVEEIKKQLEAKVVGLTTAAAAAAAAASFMPMTSPRSDMDASAKIRESLTQYKDELNKREAILTQEIESLKEKLLMANEKARRYELEKEQFAKKNSILTNTINELSEENLRLSEQVFRLNSNNLKEEFTQQDRHESIQQKWLSFQQQVTALTGQRLQQSLPALTQAYRQYSTLSQQLKLSRQQHQRRLTISQQQILDLQQRALIREQQFKFQRQRDSLDIEQLTKEVQQLQERIGELQLECQAKQNLEIEFERIEYDYNNCKILLDICKNELEELRRNYQVEVQDYVMKEQLVGDLEDILDKVHQK